MAPPETKTIAGKQYKKWAAYGTVAAANTMAHNERRMGNLARVVKFKDEPIRRKYVVYRRVKQPPTFIFPLLDAKLFILVPHCSTH